MQNTRKIQRSFSMYDCVVDIPHNMCTLTIQITY